MGGGGCLFIFIYFTREIESFIYFRIYLRIFYFNRSLFILYLFQPPSWMKYLFSPCLADIFAYHRLGTLYNMIVLMFIFPVNPI